MTEKTISEILSMSGYASYVWSSFAVSIFFLFFLFFLVKYKLKKALNINLALLADKSNKSK